MNLRISLFAVLFGFSIPLCAKPIKIQCTDTVIEYDSEALRQIFKDSQAISDGINANSRWNGSDYILQDNATIHLDIDSTGFAFMVFLEAKTDAQIFTLIDLLDEQTFKLLCLYTQMLKEKRISNLLKYKMIKNPTLQKLAEMPDDVMQNFVSSNLHCHWDYNQKKYVILSEKYLGTPLPLPIDCYPAFTTDSIYAFLVLINFYQETLNKPLPLNTEHLKNLFNVQPYEIQQTLLNKKLVILA